MQIGGKVKLKTEKNKIAALYVKKAKKNKSMEQHQNYLCLTEARNRGFEVKPEFLYEETSPKKSQDERKEIEHLIEDAKKGLFSTVIFFSLTQSADNPFEALTLKKTLADEIGIRVISLLERYDSHVYKGDDELFFIMMFALQNPDVVPPELERFMYNNEKEL